MIYDKSGDPLDYAYGLDGESLEYAYDLGGNVIYALDEDLIVNPDRATGTDSGYTFASSERPNTYVARLMIDTLVNEHVDMQSCVYDSDAKCYYVFAGDWFVHKYDSSYQFVEKITLPQVAGHNNDGFYDDGKIYLTNSKTSLFIWNPSLNTISTRSISGITDPLNGSTRSADAICKAENGFAFIACRDVYTSDIDHQEGDKLTIYKANLSTGVCTLIAEFPWDCVYVQGMVFHDGIIYVTCNTQTTGSASNYTGITVKAIRTDTWELIDELIYSGSVEPEGMDVVPADDTIQLEMGVASHYAVSKVVRFTPPYSLREEP